MNKWDEEFSAKITNLTDEIWTGSHSLKGLERIEGKIFAVIRKDRKHQQSKRLKRLPSIGDMYNCFEVIWKRNCKIFRKGTNRENVDYSYAVAQEIHKLAEDKLK